jgi:4-hydroxybenzoate polyprenyltransferase
MAPASESRVGQAGAPPVLAGGRSLWRTARLLVVALRPRQWLKNLFVLAPILFTGKAGDVGLLARALTATACFCGLSGVVYLFNDLLDRQRDALHPVKRHRPLASGALSPATAIVAGVVLTLVCLAVASCLNAHFFAVAFVYVVLMAAYNTALKNVVIADVLSIAAGFVLRAVGGCEAIAVPISPWLYICTALVTLFMALGKRRHELSRLSGMAARHRPVLRKYNEPFLDQMISITTTACLVSYLLYCVLSETASKHEGLLLTAPFVAYGLFRYLYCIYRKGRGGNPEDVVLKDKVFLGTGIAYGIAVVLVMYLH